MAQTPSSLVSLLLQHKMKFIYAVLLGLWPCNYGQWDSPNFKFAVIIKKIQPLKSVFLLWMMMSGGPILFPKGSFHHVRYL